MKWMKRSKSHLEEEEIVCGSNSNDVLLQIDESLSCSSMPKNIIDVDADAKLAKCRGQLFRKSKPVDAMQCGESSC